MRKLPRKGDVWVNRKEGSQWLVTDVAIKKKDDIRLYDDEWNKEPTGTKFIYARNETNYIFTNARVTLDEFLRDCEYYTSAVKCTCPKCELYHWKFSKVSAK